MEASREKLYFFFNKNFSQQQGIGSDRKVSLSSDRVERLTDWCREEDSQAADSWHSSKHGLACMAGSFPGNMGGWIPLQACRPALGIWTQWGEGVQDGRDMGEFGADEEKDGFWMSCIGLEGGLVVQMEDDTDKDVGRLSSEDRRACCRAKIPASHHSFTTTWYLSFFSDLLFHLSLFTYQLLLQPWLKAPELK